MDALITDPLSLVDRWAGVDITGDVNGYADKLERLLASLGDHAAFVDESAAAGQSLVAYRWSGGLPLCVDAFVEQD